MTSPRGASTRLVAVPVMNRGAVERAIRFGLAVGAKVAPLSIFARKNYFYPDLPKAYQISQYERPFSSDGWLDLPGGGKRIRIRRIQLAGRDRLAVF